MYQTPPPAAATTTTAMTITPIAVSSSSLPLLWLAASS